jgi:SAM-dependent methyltransferase
MYVEHDAATWHVYSKPEIAAHYAKLDYLSPCERILFDTHIRPGSKILDLGVGGGRTTVYLSQVASTYVGADYSEEMVRACEKKFPHLKFTLADAADLSAFADSSFDVIVFSFNGLDCIVDEARRSQCFGECRRVLRMGGVFIFSSHNPRAILVRPAWDPARLKNFARRFVSESSTLYPALIAGLTVAKAVHSCLRAFGASVSRVALRIAKPAFWRGGGTFLDQARGGHMIYCSSPHRVVTSLKMAGFESTAILGDDYPRTSRSLLTDWYYYVFTKNNVADVSSDVARSEASCA